MSKHIVSSVGLCSDWAARNDSNNVKWNPTPPSVICYFLPPHTQHVKQTVTKQMGPVICMPKKMKKNK